MSNNNNETNECCICYDECIEIAKIESFIMMLNFGYSYYPLISLSDAYGCECKTLHAHNHCLLNINKCPLCRTVVTKPKLYFITDYYYYSGILFDWLRKYYALHIILALMFYSNILDSSLIIYIVALRWFYFSNHKLLIVLHVSQLMITLAIFYNINFISMKIMKNINFAM